MRLVTLLATETRVRSELVHSIQIGPFQHTVDDGLELRKAAFECMYALLDMCATATDAPILDTYLACLIAGLLDQHDIQLLSHLMLCRLCVLCPAAICARAQPLIDAIKTTLNSKVSAHARTCAHKLQVQAKSNAVRAEVEEVGELRWSAMRAASALLRVAAVDGARQPSLTDLHTYIRSTPDLHALYVDVERESAASTANRQPTNNAR
jgi:cullin-associated NEDD8-dissociated protein 1